MEPSRALSDFELGDALNKQLLLAPSNSVARDRLYHLAREAAGRLQSRPFITRVFLRRDVALRFFTLFWWLHILIFAYLMLIALAELNRPYGRPGAPLVIGFVMVIGVAAVRWAIAGRWRLGPRL
jgi:hypothetical protein